MSRAAALVVAVMALAGPAFAAAADTAATSRRSLVITFSDRPSVPEASKRLAGLGRVRPTVPEVGVWELAPVDPATARRRSLRRPKVERAEWPGIRKVDTIEAPSGDSSQTTAPTGPPEPTDPLYLDTTRQWGMHQGLWSIGLSARERPAIAILDSGLAMGHEEWRNSGAVFAPRSTIQRKDGAEDWAEDGHGTHVTGIAAAPANGIGIVGVAPLFGPGLPGVSRVIPVQITNEQGESIDPDIMRGIRWAVNHGAKVINISSAGPDYIQAFQDTVNWAYGRGVLIVASVGNSGDQTNDYNYPAGYDHVVGVGAQCNGVVTDDCPIAFGTARWSNHNATVDLIAPGVDIPSTIPISVFGGQIRPGYGTKEGTSMASPYVAGTALLVYAANPGISPFQVSRMLYGTASRGVYGQQRTSTAGWGVVNPIGAVGATLPPNDILEPNDDVRDLVGRKAISAPLRVAVPVGPSWADANDDPFDNYPVALRKGQSLRVTVSGSGARYRLQVFQPTTGSVVPRVSWPGTRTANRRALALKKTAVAKLRLGRGAETTGTRTITVRATRSGRHIIQVRALAGGGYYDLAITRR